MTALLSFLLFLVLGIASGVLFQRKHCETSLLMNIMLGIMGALSISGLAGFLGLGGGFTTFTLWGIVSGVIGAILLPLIYSLLYNRASKKDADEL